MVSFVVVGRLRKGPACCGSCGGARGVLGRGGDQHGSLPLWGVAADRARLVAPVCARWGGAEFGGPLVASAWLSASDGGRGGGAGVGVARCSSALGADPDRLRAGARGCDPGTGSLQCVSRLGAQRAYRLGEAAS